MNKLMALLFAIACLLTATVSSRLLGMGMWYYIILISGSLVFSFQFIENLIPIARVIAILMVIISVGAVVLTLLASTIGGSSNMDEGATLLTFGFVGIAIFGFVVARITKPQKQSQGSEDLD